MPQPTQRHCQNRLLAALPAADFALLQPHLELASLSVGDVLIHANTPITQVAFVEQGIVSFISLAEDDQQIEAALVGCEGMVGVPVLLDADQTPNEARVQMLGLAWTMSANALKAALGQSPHLQRQLLRYAHAYCLIRECSRRNEGLPHQDAPEATSGSPLFPALRDWWCRVMGSQ